MHLDVLSSEAVNLLYRMIDTKKEAKKMDRVMKKEELSRELASRCGFYIKNMRDVTDALADIIIEYFIEIFIRYLFYFICN